MTVRTEDFSRHPSWAEEGTESFEALFHQHWSRVYAVIFRLVGDPAAAEGLALEVFWRLYDRPPKKRDGLSGWLYRVATNLGYNALRAGERRERYEGEAGRMALDRQRVPDPAEALERAEQREQVRRALAQLNPRDAKLLVLRHSGLTYAEVAAALGLAPGSIGTLLARAEKDFEDCYRALQGDT
jgi:RNA polymerase sigma-70 factor (ECF subfamily)